MGGLLWRGIGVAILLVVLCGLHKEELSGFWWRVPIKTVEKKVTHHTPSLAQMVGYESRSDVI